jgi:hypothetical protein
MAVTFLAAIAPQTRIDEESPKIPYKIKIRGVAADTSVNKNNWRINERLLDRVVAELKGRTLRVNHGGSVTDVIGRVTDAVREGSKVVFDADIIGSDMITNAVKEKIMNGLLDSVSIGMDGFKVVCSMCGKITRRGDKILHNPEEEHNPPGYEDIIDGSVKELSIVLDPAYDATKINISASFVAALETYMASMTTAEKECVDVDKEASNKKDAVIPLESGVTSDVGDGQDGRPTDKNAAKGDNMSAVVPNAEPSGSSAPSLDDFKRILQDAFKGYESELAKRLDGIEGRLKALEEARMKSEEAEDARRKAEEAKKAEEAEEAEEARRKAEEAKDKDEDEDKDEKDDYEAKLEKSTTVIGKTPTIGGGWDKVIAELNAAYTKQKQMV